MSTQPVLDQFYEHLLQTRSPVTAKLYYVWAAKLITAACKPDAQPAITPSQIRQARSAWAALQQFLPADHPLKGLALQLTPPDSPFLQNRLIGRVVWQFALMLRRVHRQPGRAKLPRPMLRIGSLTWQEVLPQYRIVRSDGQEVVMLVVPFRIIPGGSPSSILVTLAELDELFMTTHPRYATTALQIWCAQRWCDSSGTPLPPLPLFPAEPDSLKTMPPAMLKRIPRE